VDNPRASTWRRARELRVAVLVAGRRLLREGLQQGLLQLVKFGLDLVRFNAQARQAAHELVRLRCLLQGHHEVSWEFILPEDVH
jgi:hypothetical protein